MVTGRGRLTGCLDNRGTVRPDQPDTPLEAGAYVERGVLDLALAAGDPPTCTALRAGQVTIEAGAELRVRFTADLSEADLETGDEWDVLLYPATAGALEGTYDTIVSEPPLADGHWSLTYDQDARDGLACVRLAYTGDAIGVQESELPRSFALTNVYPNPFNPQAVIAYALPRTARVSFRLFDLRGRMVWSHDATQAAGRHRLTLSGQDREGRPLPSGTYLLRMRGEGFSAARRLMLVR